MSANVQVAVLGPGRITVGKFGLILVTIALSAVIAVTFLVGRMTVPTTGPVVPAKLPVVQTQTIPQSLPEMMPPSASCGTTSAMTRC